MFRPSSHATSDPKEAKMQAKSIPEMTTEQLDAFWAKVDVPYQPSCCWEWLGGVDAGGYGRCSPNKHMTRVAYRVSYTLLIGPIPLDMQIDHLCRNPRCVNPDHLQIVDSMTNNRRGFSPTSLNAKKTHCPRGHSYSGENLGLNRNGSRYCKSCKRVDQSGRKRIWNSETKRYLRTT